MGKLSTTSFSGFGADNLCEVPCELFTQLLPELKDADEIKITLYALWHAWQNGFSLGFTQFDIEQDSRFFKSLSSPLSETLRKVVEKNILIAANKNNTQRYYVNSQAGRDAALRLAHSDIPEYNAPGFGIDGHRSEIFSLYENNIGALTPMMSEILAEAEKAYPLTWIEKAITIAVKNNIRRWRYVEAIIKSWQQEGFDGENRANTEADYRRYIRGEFSEYVQH